MSVDTVLLTLGRLPVAVDIARSFAAGGWRVVVAEPFGMHLARMSRAVAKSYRVPAPADGPGRYLAALREVVLRENVRLVVPVSEETLHVAALAGSLPEGCGIYCTAQQEMLSLHDKLEFPRRAAGLGLAVPATAPAGSADAERIAAAGDFVVKPRHSCSGRGVVFRRCGESAFGAAGTVVQALAIGEPLSSFAVLREGELLASIVYRGVVMSGSVAVCFERVDKCRAIETWVREFAAGTRHTGFLAFDFMVDEDGRAVAIECNPRATSGIHFLDPATLAPAVLGERLALARADELLAESWSCFTACLGALPDLRRFLADFGRLHRARDITWSRRDPWPFLAMPVNTWPLIRRAIRNRRTFAEVAALDIEWVTADV